MRTTTLLAFAVLCFAAPSAGAITEVVAFGSNPGALRMYEHVPAGASVNLPLVLVLHGCAQDHSYATQVGLVGLAEELGVALVLAEQTSANNANECFNWFEDGDITRDQGEALSLVQMVDDMQSRHDIDAGRIFVTGLSAGGAMTAVMLAAYPEVFAGGAVFAGVSYRCGTGTGAAFDCLSNGSGETRAVMAERVLDASTHSGPWPRVQIWHGTSDTTVAAQNALDLAQQWSAVHGLPATPSVTGSLGPASRSVWRQNGIDAVELLELPGMNHGTPVDPGGGTGQCGTAGAFVLDVNLCASMAMLNFFGLDAAAEGEDEGEGDAPSGCDCGAGGAADLAGLGLLLGVAGGRRRR